MTFKQFIVEADESMKDVKSTIAKLPHSHQRLVKGYKFKFEAGNTLKGDKGHVGIIDDGKRTITVASPWNYGREFTLLHEIGHLVWKHKVDKKLRKKWASIAKTTKNKMKDSPEELFCMAYANHYASNKVEIHNHASWDSFVKAITR